MDGSPGDGLAIGADGRARCYWCVGDPTYVAYHDQEWGRPVVDDRPIFEKVCLEGFQAGLSWWTILRKRDNFRRAFADFDPTAVASFGAGDVERLLGDAGIIRHAGKIRAVINNARRYHELAAESGSLAAYVWSFEPDADTESRPLDRDGLLAIGVRPEAKRMSADLRRRGWSFVGPTTIQSAMQSLGLVNDHVAGCHVRAVVDEERARLIRPRMKKQEGRPEGRPSVHG